MIKVRKATKDDYEKFQGGIPEVTKDGSITIITHQYPRSEGMVIRTRQNYEPVIIGGVEYNTNLLRKFHGDPCEKQSRLAGGQGYPRKGESE